MKRFMNGGCNRIGRGSGVDERAGCLRDAMRLQGGAIGGDTGKSLSLDGRQGPRRKHRNDGTRSNENGEQERLGR
jgi:hypothetical protein